MKKLKTMLILVLAVGMLFSAVGCSMITVNEERDKEQVVATVNGVEIKKEEILRDIDAYYQMYGITDDNRDTQEGQELLSRAKTLLLDDYIEAEIIRQQAEAMGLYPLTDEELQQAKEDAEAMGQSLTELHQESVKSDVEEDPSLDYDTELNARLEESLLQAGVSNGALEAGYIRDTIETKVKEAVTADVQISDEEVQAWYDEQLAEQKESLDEAPETLSDIESSTISVYVPEGLRYVKHILIAIPDEAADEISSLRTDGDTEGADALRDEELAKLKPKAEEVLAKVQAGEDFDSLIAEYGEDPGMESNEEGYLISEGNTDYVEEFVQAGMALEKVGDTSGLVASDYGYHIIQYASEKTAGAIPLEDVKTEIYEKLMSDTIESTWEDQLSAWMSEAEVVKYENRL